MRDFIERYHSEINYYSLLGFLCSAFCKVILDLTQALLPDTARLALIAIVLLAFSSKEVRASVRELSDRL